MKNKYKNTSRRKTPWDNKENLSPLEGFIKSKYLDSFDYKHPNLNESGEVELLNSYVLENCRHCNSNNIVKRGYTKNGIQRYFCNDCKKSFTITTKTIFEDHKISITEWIEFCLDIFRYESLSNTAKTNKNASTTTKLWFKKLSLLLEDYQKDIILKENVYIDETYFPVIQSDKITKDNKQLRGLSKNQICIAIGYDGTNTIAIVEGVGKTSQAKTKQAFISHIEKKSHLIHDKEKAHKALVKELSLTEETYDANECKKLSDKDNPLNPINQKCRYLQRFLRSHSGFNRDELQDYLNLFCFITNPPINKLDKVKMILDSAIHLTKSLKYRVYYAKK